MHHEEIKCAHALLCKYIHTSVIWGGRIPQCLKPRVKFLTGVLEVLFESEDNLQA